MRLLLATNEPALDAHFKGLAWLGVCGEVYYREALPKAEEADVALVSAYLPGEMDMLEALFSLRRRGIRVIYLAGDLSCSDPFLADLIALGVYDVFLGEATMAEIEERIKSPASFEEALRLLQPPSRPKGSRLLSLARSERRDEPEPASPERQKRLPAVPVPRISLAPKPASKAPEEAFEPPAFGVPAVGVWSPRSSGKTFVAVGLSRALAKALGGCALLDLDPKLSVFGWMCLPQGESSLLSAMKDSLGPVPEGFSAGKVTVYSSDPSLGAPPVSAHSVARLLSSVKAPVAVLDLPSEAEWLDAVLGACSVAVLVGDPDWSRSRAYKEAAGRLPNAVLVVNRHADPGLSFWSSAEVFGREPDVLVPCEAPAVYASAVSGRPPKSEALGRAFDALARKVMQKLGGV